MNLPIHCAAFPGLSLLNTRAVIVYRSVYCHNLPSELSECLNDILISYAGLEFRTSRCMDLHPYTLITRSRIFADRKILGPFSIAKVVSLIFPDWPNLEISSSL
jgi:hypothetical protein